MTVSLISGGNIANPTTTIRVLSVLGAQSGVNGGVLTVTNLSGSAIAGGATTTLLWSTSVNDTLPALLKVTSSQDSVGYTFSATETDRSSGRFRATIQLVDVENPNNISTTTVSGIGGGPFASTTATSGRIKIQNGGILTVTYLDDSRTSNTTAALSSAAEVSATVTADSVGPTVSVTGPTHNKQTQDRRPVFSGTVTDTASGIKLNTVRHVSDNTNDATNATVVSTSTSASSTPTLGSSAADGDATVTWTFTPSVDIPTTGNSGTDQASHKVDWLVWLSDMAGNFGWSDADGDATDNFAWIGTPAGGEGAPSGRGQAHVVKIDATVPSLVSSGVFTGHYWDTSLSTPALAEDKLTSIEVRFNDDIDAATVAGSDFKVTISSVDQTPTAAEVFSGSPASVFLTLATAMKSSDTPTVAIVGDISDTAGNKVTAASLLSQTAKDSVKPGLTVTLSGGSSAANPGTVTNDKMTIDIVSDEKLTGDPTVQIYNTGSVLESGVTLTAINQGGNAWKAYFTKTGRSTGTKSVLVTADDAVGSIDGRLNRATKGNADSTTSTAIKFTLDTAAPTVALQTASTDVLQPFVVMVFSEAVVSIQKATIGGVDISSKLSASTDKKNYTYKPTADLAVQAHTIVVQGTDDAGNKSAETTLTLTITERAKFELPLNPGWNLVSLRADPVDPAINAVATPAGISSVIAYDPAAKDGPWVVATRGADGKLVGSLTTMDSSRGYWINTTSFEAIKVLDARVVGGSLPPTIALRQGWNLVPARDVSASIVAGSTLAAANVYFSGANAQRAYSFDTVLGTYSPVTLSGASPTNVAVGKAYWVYASAAGTITP